MPFIDLKAQYAALKPSIQNRMDAVLEHGQYIMGPEVQALECELADFVGAEHCVSVSSGTDALLISLLALGVGAGDEVVTTPFTFAATVEMIVLLGARPVFVDIEADTGNLNAALLEEKITPATRAIIPVSLYGQPADMDEINAVARRHGDIPVIEDAAQSLGSSYKGNKSCNLSTIGCTSFFPSKPLGCYGDGGALFTNDAAVAEACKEIRVHGQVKRYTHDRVGVGGRMDTLQCAVVLAKLERFSWEIKRRKEIGAHYNAICDEVGIQRVQQKKDRDSVFAQYTVFVEDRDAFVSKLESEGIPTAVHYPIPMNQQVPYRQYCCTDCTPVAKWAADRVVSLPMGPYLTDEAQAHIWRVLSL
ncbi:DegT/DnrJ/EryC1/StrS family aminotransferase [Luminiphilus sp.]|nr:DegT/DnrJ/EryC1/StrS family aminotransferase [Luminiphilus sp.]